MREEDTVCVGSDGLQCQTLHLMYAGTPIAQIWKNPE